MPPASTSFLTEASINIRCPRRLRDELHRVAQARQTTLSGLMRQVAIDHLPLQLNK